MRIFFRLFVGSVCSLLLATWAFAQQSPPPVTPIAPPQQTDAAQQAPEPLTLQHADSLVGSMTPQGMVRELIGNVVLLQNAVTVTCDRAIHYMTLNKADLVGNVVMTQNTVTMKAPRGTYDGMARIIYGLQGVYLQDRNTTLTAREGVYSTETRIARFYKNVLVENDSLKIYSDTLEYHRETQNSYATGTVSAAGKFTSAYLQGDSLVNIPDRHYTRVSCYKPSTNASVRATGATLKLPTATAIKVSTAATIKMPSKPLLISLVRQPMISQIDTVQVEEDIIPADSLKPVPNSKKTPKKSSSNSAISSAANSPTKPAKSNIQTIDSLSLPIAMPTKRIVNRLDTLCIVGDVLEAFRADKQERYVATDNVKLTRGGGKSSIAARAGTGIYEKTLDRIWMLQTPVLWIDSTQLRGDSILINVREKRLERVVAHTNAFAATKNDTTRQDRIDQLTGDNIIINTQQDTLRSILAEGKAFNLYFLTTEDDSIKTKKNADGAARNAADTIKIWFDKGEPDRIVWLGKVEGEAIPEHIVQKTLAELKLKGFQWFTNKPHLQRFDKNAKPPKPVIQNKAETVVVPLKRKNASKSTVPRIGSPPKIP